jgi:hypothetical protein
MEENQDFLLESKKIEIKLKMHVLNFLKVFKGNRTSVSIKDYLRKTELQIAILFFGIGSLIAIASGADSSFDLLNYHLFNGWRTLNLGGNDYLPTSIWTFFPSVLDGIFYLLWKLTSPAVLNFLIGGLQGLIGFFAYRFVKQFEVNYNRFSASSFIVGILTLSSPLTRSQFGSSMGDLTLVIIEIFLFTEIVSTKLRGNSMPACKIAILLGLTLALKPAHVSIIVVLGMLSLFSCKFFDQIKFAAIAFSSFILFSLPWWIKAFVVTGSPLFPYFLTSQKEILSSPAVLHSYPLWVVHTFSDLLKHTFYPGGGPTINSEVPFLDFAVPLGVIVLLLSFIVHFSNSLNRQIKNRAFFAGQLALSAGILSFVINQMIFTGVRYVLASYSLIWLGLGLIVVSNTRKFSKLVSFFLVLVFCFNTFRPETTYFPVTSAAVTIAPVPDFGRMRGAYLYNPANHFSPPYQFNSEDIVLLGQEQTSFLGPLWGINAQFVGLQAYILGKDASVEINRRLKATIIRGGKIYLVALSVNLATERAQLATISTDYDFNACLEVPNPYERTLSMCRVNLKSEMDLRN